MYYRIFLPGEDWPIYGLEGCDSKEGCGTSPARLNSTHKLASAHRLSQPSMPTPTAHHKAIG
jgi:hypothetical protein